jgi:hypothetical protein
MHMTSRRRGGNLADVANASLMRSAPRPMGATVSRDEVPASSRDEVPASRSHSEGMRVAIGNPGSHPNASDRLRFISCDQDSFITRSPFYGIIRANFATAVPQGGSIQ